MIKLPCLALACLALVSACGGEPAAGPQSTDEETESALFETLGGGYTCSDTFFQLDEMFYIEWRSTSRTYVITTAFLDGLQNGPNYELAVTCPSSIAFSHAACAAGSSILTYCATTTQLCQMKSRVPYATTWDFAGDVKVYVQASTYDGAAGPHLKLALSGIADCGLFTLTYFDLH